MTSFLGGVLGYIAAWLLGAAIREWRLSRLAARRARDLAARNREVALFVATLLGPNAALEAAEAEDGSRGRGYVQ